MRVELERDRRQSVPESESLSERVQYRDRDAPRAYTHTHQTHPAHTHTHKRVFPAVHLSHQSVKTAIHQLDIARQLDSSTATLDRPRQTSTDLDAPAHGVSLDRLDKARQGSTGKASTTGSTAPRRSLDSSTARQPGLKAARAARLAPKGCGAPLARAQSVAHWEQRSLGAALERLHHQAALARIPGELHAASPVRINIEGPGGAPRRNPPTPLSIVFLFRWPLATELGGGNATILERTYHICRAETPKRNTET